MTLLKTSALNAIAVAVRMLTALGLNKILAYSVGPSGYAVIGQFQNIVSMLTTFASGAINTGVTKFTSEYADDAIRQRLVWKTAGSIAAACTGVSALSILFLHERLAIWLLHDPRFSGVFIWLGFGLVALALNALLLAILNGRKEIKRYVIISISGSVIGLVSTGCLALNGGVYGALVALAINQSLVVVVTLLLCFRAPWFRFGDLWGQIDIQIARGLGKYTLMALTSAATLPVSQIIIRNYLAEHFGWVVTGHWQAVSKISELYLMLIVSTLSLYYLPRLAEIKSSAELTEEIAKTYRVVLPAALLGAGAIYIFRNFITTTLFAPSFLPMCDLFLWQVVGDVMKIGSWILAYVMIGQSMTRAYIITEIMFGGLLIILVIIGTGIYGIEGAPMAYAACYGIYWLTMTKIIGGHLARMRRREAFASYKV